MSLSVVIISFVTVMVSVVATALIFDLTNNWWKEVKSRRFLRKLAKGWRDEDGRLRKIRRVPIEDSDGPYKRRSSTTNKDN